MAGKPKYPPGSRFRPCIQIDRALYAFVQEHLDATGYLDMRSIFQGALELQVDKIAAIKGIKYGVSKGRK